MQHIVRGQQGQQEQSLQSLPSISTPPLLPIPTASPPSTPPALPAQQAENEVRFGIIMLAPPVMDGRMILPRADDVSNVLRMLGHAQVSAVVLTGDAGAGKSTLAALAFRQLQAAARAGSSPFRHLLWLGLGSNSSVPDCLAALLSSLRPDKTPPPDFMHVTPQQQLAHTAHALRQPQNSSLVVIDQFDDLLDDETGLPLPGRGATPLFFQLLKQDLGASRVLLTCHHSPFGSQNEEQSRARVSMLSHISMPEGTALLQQRGVVSVPQELSLVWQRCAGNVYALTLFAALVHLSGFSLSYLLNAPDYQYMWNGDVLQNLVGIVYNFLSPIQRTLLRALCLFNEPVSMDGILAAITGEARSIDTTAFERELAALTRLALVQYTPAARRKRGESTTGHVCYFLHSRIRHYTIDHYLEGTDRRNSGILRSAVGVSDGPNPITANPEAREIALAAGHMRVTTYYARQSQLFYIPQEQRSGPLDVAPLLAVMEHLCLGWHWQQAYDMLLEEKLHERLAQWGAWNTLIRLYTAMIPPSGIVTRSDGAFIYGHLGLIYGRLGDYQTGDFYFQQALTAQLAIHDTRGEITTLINQGELLRSAGQTRQARAAFEEARRLLQEPDAPSNASLESALLHNMGLLAQGEKDFEQALRYYLDALKVARTMPEPYNLGMILTNTGMLFFEQGKLPEALSLLLQAAQVRQAAQDPTVATLTLFLQALEQKLGPPAYAQLQQKAQQL